MHKDIKIPTKTSSNIIGDAIAGYDSSKHYWNIYWTRYMKNNNLKYNIIPIGTKVNLPILFYDKNIKGRITKIMLPGYQYKNTPVAELRYQIHTFDGRDVVMPFHSLHPINESNYIHLSKNGEDRSSNNANNKVTERKWISRNCNNLRSEK